MLPIFPSAIPVGYNFILKKKNVEFEEQFRDSALLNPVLSDNIGVLSLTFPCHCLFICGQNTPAFLMHAAISR